MGFEDSDAISKTIRVAFACGGKEIKLENHPTYDSRCHTIDVRQAALTACGRS